MHFEYLFLFAVLIVGVFGALGWWRIAAKAAPYDDEIARRKGKAPKGPRPTVIRDADWRATDDDDTHSDPTA